MVRELGHGEVSPHPVEARIHRGRLLVVLRLEEVGEDVLVAPAWVASPSPRVIVGTGAADVHHPVENTRATQDLKAEDE